MGSEVTMAAKRCRRAEESMIQLLILFLTSVTSTSAFTKTSICCSKESRSQRKCTQPLHASADSNDGAIKKAYNDNALLNFHMMTQAQKIRDYSAMDTFVNTQSMWNLAWHDSFVRNGLADFVPPMTGELNVLVVGAGRNQQLIRGSDNVLGDGDDPSAATRDIELMPEESNRKGQKKEVDASLKVNSSALQHLQQDSSCSFLAAIFDDTSGDERSRTDELEFVMYDCIMDEGLIADLVRTSPDNDTSNKNKQDVARLLLEATKRIREMGIYVANTPPMSLEDKSYLQMLGEILGLQWEFDLDGISDENKSVSVARKFGTCPTIGWQTMVKLLNE